MRILIFAVFGGLVPLEATSGPTHLSPNRMGSIGLFSKTFHTKGGLEASPVLRFQKLANWASLSYALTMQNTTTLTLMFSEPVESFSWCPKVWMPNASVFFDATNFLVAGTGKPFYCRANLWIQPS